jgi:hypothetical protein
MNRLKILGFGLFGALLLSLVTLGCGSDDDDDNDTAGTGGAGGGGADTVTFQGKLLDNPTEVPVPGVTVQALDNESGEKLGIKAVSESDGSVTLKGLPKGKVGFLAVGTPGKSVDTFQYNIDSDAKDEQLWIFAKNVADLVPTLADFTTDPTKAYVGGALYWVNDKGEEEPVGCATVRIEGDLGEPRYFGNANLPIRDTPNPDDPEGEYRTDSNPLNGRFFFANIPPGKQKIYMVVDGADVGSTELMLFAGEESSDGELSVCISNIYVEGMDENPTPADCE